ncbi:MAG TPA: ATP-binding protein [Xanthobacteraceae bacterium]|nr:ATP-binding protein [Xanthobacteraceae bacterium]
MNSARETAIRLLLLMMIASVMLPAALFVYASWISYRDIHAVADERIGRSLDVMQEQALKVFQTVDRTFAEVNEIVRGMSDEDIRVDAPRLHERLAGIVATMPQLYGILLLGRDGRPLAASTPAVMPAGANLTDRDYFQAQLDDNPGTYVSDTRDPRLPGIGDDFFDLSHRLESPDGSFSGVIAVAVRPKYFEDFYQLIGRTPGSFYALVRSDGAYLARYPALQDRRRRLTAASTFRTTIARGVDHGLYTAKSDIDGISRRFGFRKLPGYPVYALAGVTSAALRAEWLSNMLTHLLVGVPAVLLVLAVLWVALRRTRRLYDEAERREAAEGALRQAQRLEAIGQLTGGVAHDFNNLLMIVSGSVHRLRRELSGEKQQRLLDAIGNATQRGESLTRQLLAFSRRQMLQPCVIDLTRRLPELKEMLSRSLRGDIEIRVVVPSSPCLVKADPSELELALFNLAFNARDAMPSGGTLTITVKPIMLRGKANEEGLSGEFVAVRIADTGEGIAPEVLPRVFEPFFTTKEVGKGTGLGLSQVYGFARQSGGAATITSALRRGTAITLFLPRSFEVPAQPSEPSIAASAPLRAGTVLVVEDNGDVVEVAGAYFADLGYVVKTAASAQAGLELLEREGGIDLVFSDILMPGGMNGLDLAKAVRERFANVIVLLTTGYSSSAQDAMRQGFEVLQKPYDLAALERALLNALKAAGRTGTPAARVRERATG